MLTFIIVSSLKSSWRFNFVNFLLDPFPLNRLRSESDNTCGNGYKMNDINKSTPRAMDQSSTTPHRTGPAAWLGLAFWLLPLFRRRLDRLPLPAR
jgi:hypothetical protein